VPILEGQVHAPEPLGPARVVIDGARIVAIDPIAAAPDRILCPGLVDLQVNGAGGVDAWDEVGMGTIADVLLRGGVTAYLATLVSAPARGYREALRRLAPVDRPGTARLLGAHVEGPFIAVAGAHDPTHLRDPTIAEIEGWLATGVVGIVTLAPELPGALAAIARLHAAGVVVALGHSRADEATARAALAAGASLGTHLYNAMPALHHRAPGLAGALLDSSASLSLIADGVHVGDTALRIAWRVAGPRRLVLVSDAMAGLGLPPGPVRLGSSPATSDGTVARLADGTLAGSVTPLLAGVQRLVRCGVPLEDALRAASTNPAALLGLADGTGRLVAGGRADVLELDRGLGIVRVVAGGVEVA
jgi:N-acetylglucosamine-6-phosphate deacetylase